MFHWCRGWWGARGQTMHPPLLFNKICPVIQETEKEDVF